MNDKEVERLWEELKDVPLDEINGELALVEDWHIFKKGTDREEIWHYFDEEHSKGVAYLLYEYNKASK